MRQFWARTVCVLFGHIEWYTCTLVDDRGESGDCTCLCCGKFLHKYRARG